MPTINIKIPVDVKKRFKVHMAKKGTSMKAFLLNSILQELNRKVKNDKRINSNPKD